MDITFSAQPQSELLLSCTRGFEPWEVHLVGQMVEGHDTELGGVKAAKDPGRGTLGVRTALCGRPRSLPLPKADTSVQHRPATQAAGPTATSLWSLCVTV